MGDGVELDGQGTAGLVHLAVHLVEVEGAAGGELLGLTVGKHGVDDALIHPDGPAVPDPVDGLRADPVDEQDPASAAPGPEVGVATGDHRGGVHHDGTPASTSAVAVSRSRSTWSTTAMSPGRRRGSTVEVGLPTRAIPVTPGGASDAFRALNLISPHETPGGALRAQPAFPRGPRKTYPAVSLSGPHPGRAANLHRLADARPLLALAAGSGLPRPSDRRRRRGSTVRRWW